MYNVHQDAKLLPLKVQSPDYVFGSDKLQAVSASASIDSTGKTHVSLVNIDSKNAQTITVTMDGGKIQHH